MRFIISLLIVLNYTNTAYAKDLSIYYDLEHEALCGKISQPHQCGNKAHLKITPRFISNENNSSSLIVDLETFNFEKISKKYFGDGQSFTIDLKILTKTVGVSILKTPIFQASGSNLKINSQLDTHGLGIKPRNFSINLQIYNQENRFDVSAEDRPLNPGDICGAGASPIYFGPEPKKVKSLGASISLNIDDIPGVLDRKLASYVNKPLRLLSIFTGNLKLLGFGETYITFHANGTNLKATLTSILPENNFGKPLQILNKIYPELSTNPLQVALQISTDKSLQDKLEKDFLKRLTSTKPRWPIGSLSGPLCKQRDGSVKLVP